MTSYLAITTCNAALWEKYGRAMANTFDRHWPEEVPLVIYAEEFAPVGHIYLDLDRAAPWLAPWKAERTKAQRGIRPPNGKLYTFKLDAVRFSHKIAAIGAAAETAGAEVLIWMDADIVTHEPVTVDWLDGLFPPSADIAWLDRAKTYPECGFMMFRLPSALGVIRDLVKAYQTGAIFRMVQTHDSFVIGEIVKAAVARGEVKVASLSGEARDHHHVFVAGPLGAKCDHLKGKRKERGKSWQADLMGLRPEPYWQP